MIRPHARTMVAFVVALWLLAIAGGLRLLWGYSTKPGQVASAEIAWPAGTRLERDPNLATLVMFVHPMCPCSRASAAELSRLMAHCDGKLRVTVLATQPPGAPQDWHDTDLIAQLRAIPGVNLIVDPNGEETKRFGAKTSGQTNLYDKEGRLLFSGGITAARGHEGDNAGSNAIVAFVHATPGERPITSKTPVYGCSLLGAETVPKPTGTKK